MASLDGIESDEEAFSFSFEGGSGAVQPYAFEPVLSSVVPRVEASSSSEDEDVSVDVQSSDPVMPMSTTPCTSSTMWWV